MSLGTILIIILILILLGVIPSWGHSRDWGYGPSGIVGLILIILLILLQRSIHRSPNLDPIEIKFPTV